MNEEKIVKKIQENFWKFGMNVPVSLKYFLEYFQKYLELSKKFSEEFLEAFRIISEEYLEEELRKITETNFEGSPSNF